MAFSKNFGSSRPSAWSVFLTGMHGRGGVNAINPGLVLTEGVKESGFLSDIKAQVVAATPLGRLGHPDDIALPAVFLASDAARWITGETIFVSGGAGI